MASIEMLDIAGIRSFAPDTPQAIKFYKPVTVIVGANGCGKTTIIECLKYVTTGTLPPGAKSGHAFIHDPKIAEKTEVKARIRLRFRPRGPRFYEITRTFQLTQTRKTTQVKQLEGVLATKAEDNTVIERLSQRCSDLDKTMPTLLGVSKAILENVVFCHQEESNWPMQDGAALKKKFDDIFESTRYTKALEDVRKQKKALAEQLKELKAELDLFLVHRSAAHELRDEIEAKQEALARQAEEIAALDASIHELQARQSELNSKVSAVSDKRNDLTLALERVAQASDEQDAMRAEVQAKGLEGDLESATFEETETMLEELKSVVTGLESRLQAEEHAVERAARNVSEAETHQAELKTQEAVLETKQRILEDLIQQYDQMATEASSNFSFSYIGPYDASKAASVSSEMSSVFSTIRSNLQSARAKMKSELTSIERGVTEARVKHERAKQDVNSKQQEASAIGRAIDDLRARTARLKSQGASGESMDELRRKLANADAELQAFEASNGIAALEEQARSVEQELNTLREKQSELSATAARCRQEQDKLTRLAAKKDQLAGKRQQTKLAFAGMKPKLEIHFGRAPPPSEVLQEVQRLVDQQTRQLRLLEDAAKETGSVLAQVEGKQKACVDERRRLEGEIRIVLSGPLSAFVDESGMPQDPEKRVSELREAQGNLQNGLYSADSCERVINGFLSKARSNNACYACARRFVDDAELQTAIATLIGLKDKMSKHDLDATQRELAAVEAELETAEASRSLYSEWKAKSARLEVLKSEIAAIEAEIVTCRARRKEAEDRRSTGAAALEDIRQLVADAATVDHGHQESIALEREVTDMESLLSPSASTTSLADAEAALKELETRRNACEKERYSASENLQQAREKQNKLRSDVYKLKESISSLESTMAEVTKLEASIQDKSAMREEASSKAASLATQVPALAAELRQQEQRRDQVAKTHDREVEEIQRKVTLCDTSIRALERLVTQIRNADKDEPRRRLEEVRDQLRRATTTMVDARKSLTASKGKTDQTRALIAEQETLRADCLTLQKYRNAAKKVSDLQKQVVDLEKSIQDVEGTLEDVPRMLEEVEQQLIKARDRRSRRHGAMKTIESVIENTEEKLSDDKYHQIDKRCRDALIKHETTQLAVADLERYYSALDMALMHYHNLKIREINAIIRDLWTNTYRGQDIENIEIRSDLDDDTKASTTRKSRNYNYRVVMTKGDAELDMKGRCSAGQKVLASLVIRLALAESFCVNCGILALDEPTTNLDAENKEGLAKAIADIIDNRRRQSNFQLIIITHEEEFVEMLGRAMQGGGGPSRGLGHYFRVFREETESGKWHSRIERQDFGFE